MKTKTRFFALIICSCLILQILSGCSLEKQPTVPENASEYFAEGKIEGDLTYNAKGTFSVTLTTDSSTFADKVTTKNVNISYSVIDDETLPEIQSDNGIALSEKEYKKVTITPKKVTKLSENSISIDFTDKNFIYNLPANYSFTVDKSVVSDNKFVFAGADIKYQSFSLVSDTTQVLSDEKDFKIKLTLDGGTFREEMSEKSIRFSSGFSGLEINSFSRESDNTIAITASGTLNNDEYATKYGNGEITVLGTAINNGLCDVTASVKILYPKAIANTSGFEAVNGSIRLPVSLKDCNFSENISGDLFTITGNDDLSITKFEKTSETDGVLYLSCDEQDTDLAVEKLESVIITISSKALSIRKALSFECNLYKASLTAAISGIAEKGSNYEITATITAVNGNLSKLYADKLVFGGDFSKATVITSSLTDNVGTIVFRIPKTMSVDTVELSGTIGITSGYLLNSWGTKSDSQFTTVYYDAENEARVYSVSDIVKIGKISEGEQALDLLSQYNSQGKFDQLLGLLNMKNDTERFDKLFDNIGNINVNVNKITKQLNDIISGAGKNQNSVEISSCRNTLQNFMSKCSDLWIYVETLKPQLDQLFILEKQLEQLRVAETDDDKEAKRQVELKNAEADYNKIKSSIISSVLGNADFVELTISVGTMLVQSPNGTGYGVLESFDKLIESMYNWENQTFMYKNEFRYCITSLYTQAAIISSFAMQNSTISDRSLETLRKQITKVDLFIKAKSVILRKDGKILCLTLNKVFSLEPKVSSNALNSVVTLTTTELTQLESMVSAGSTLKSEMTTVGFNLGNVKYLICSDNNYQKSTTTNTILAPDSVGYGVTNLQKVYVYDLTKGEFVSDFVCFNSNYISEIQMSDLAVNRSEKTYTHVTLYYI